MPPTPQWHLQLEEELDYELLVRLRDGRLYVGVLRSFDQFGNMLLDNVSQRLTAYHPEFKKMCYADLHLGSLIIRGDNMMLFGRIRDQTDLPPDPPTLSPPVPLSPIPPSSCQMLELPLDEISKLLLDGPSPDQSTSRNFLWVQTPGPFTDDAIM